MKHYTDNWYKVIAVSGGDDRRQGGIGMAQFPTFEKAKDYWEKNNELGNFHIKMPDDTWWPADYPKVRGL